MNYNVFNDKKVYIFVPHQDDEINIAYGLIYKIKNNVKEMKVIYATNGNYIVKDKYRLKEGIDSLKKVGLKKEDIIFMGYSDQIPEEKTHLYHENYKWYDNANNYTTKTPWNNDYHYLKYNEHAVFNKNNFINDISDIILDKLPDIIISIDFDSHPDHRALSLSVENALGKILNKNMDYHPLVLKAFAYPTSYKGFNDFSYNNKSTKFLKEENSLDNLQNPYYSWNDRIIFKNPKKATNYLYLYNICFYGLLQHKSQYILNRINQIINNDSIFFMRNTNNLLFGAKISTSSGDKKYLNDFMLYDTDNITGGINRLVDINKGFTILEKKDLKKQIDIEFNPRKNINIIKIYVKPGVEKKVNNIIIKANNKKIDKVIQYQNNTYIINELNLTNITKINIIFDSDEDVYIGEIEVLENQTTLKYSWLEINNSVHNDYYYTNLPKCNIITNMQTNDFHIITNKNKINLIYKNEIIDTIKLHKIHKCAIRTIELINKASLLLGRIYQKIIKEIRKLVGKFNNKDS